MTQDRESAGRNAAATRCPAGREVARLTELAHGEGMSDVYERVRARHGAVAPVLLDGDVPAWLVLGYPELCHVTSRPDLFARDPARWNQWHRIPPNWPLLPFVAYQGDSSRRSAVVTEVLEQVDGFELERTCRDVATELIGAFAHQGRAELMNAYVHALPLLVLVRMCGIRVGGDEAAELLDDLRIGLDTEAAGNSADAFARIDQRIRNVVAHKRSRPAPDAISQLLGHPARLSDDEVVAGAITVIGAAQQPTAHWIGNTLHLLLTDDRFAVRVLGGRLSTDEALNEVLWLNSPSQNLLGRWAIRDTVLAGVGIRAGDCLVLGIAAANSDPQVLSEALAGESNRAHLAFGNGGNRCPYAATLLADIIARTAIETLLEQLPDVALATHPDTLRWRPSPWVRGLTALPVEFTPVDPAPGLI
ncbi:cytochrome P450 [Streptomyces sp. NPDC093223]|uniref:cytochrome P450 n=1 Tax=Streptomyces sp. NPDC093223 TaxID=3366033 RepID=UPI00380ED5EE